MLGLSFNSTNNTLTLGGLTYSKYFFTNNSNGIDAYGVYIYNVANNPSGYVGVAGIVGGKKVVFGAKALGNVSIPAQDPELGDSSAGTNYNVLIGFLS